jgi:hypothetical protein
VAEPAEFLILQHLRDALRAMSISGGYHFDVAGSAVKLDPSVDVEDVIAPDGPRPYLLVEMKPETFSYRPMLQMRMTLAFTVHWVGEQIGRDDESWIRTFYQACADIEKAVTVDFTRGGRAEDTRIVKRTFDAMFGTQVWTMVDLEIATNRTYGQPNAA